MTCRVFLGLVFSRHRDSWFCWIAAFNVGASSVEDLPATSPSSAISLPKDTVFRLFTPVPGVTRIPLVGEGATFKLEDWDVWVASFCLGWVLPTTACPWLWCCLEHGVPRSADFKARIAN